MISTIKVSRTHKRYFSEVSAVRCVFTVTGTPTAHIPPTTQNIIDKNSLFYVSSAMMILDPLIFPLAPSFTIHHNATAILIANQTKKLSLFSVYNPRRVGNSNPHKQQV
jgi:hypothetical protein